jgi:hypothetical protein
VTYASFAAAARSVVFLSTPPIGADMAKVLTRLKTVLRTNAAGKDLIRVVPRMCRISMSGIAIGRLRRPRNLGFFQAYKIFGVQVVDADSPDPGLCRPDRGWMRTTSPTANSLRTACDLTSQDTSLLVSSHCRRH